jgi:hypothetical protein
LTPITRSHSSGAVSWIGFGKAIPALQIITSIRPNASNAVLT